MSEFVMSHCPHAVLTEKGDYRLMQAETVRGKARIDQYGSLMVIIAGPSPPYALVDLDGWWCCERALRQRHGGLLGCYLEKQ